MATRKERRRFAEKARDAGTSGHGRWRAGGVIASEILTEWMTIVSEPHGSDAAYCYDDEDGHTKADHIAANDPATVLADLDMLDEYEATIKKLTTEIAYLRRRVAGTLLRVDP